MGGGIDGTVAESSPFRCVKSADSDALAAAARYLLPVTRVPYRTCAVPRDAVYSVSGIPVPPIIHPAGLAIKPHTHSHPHNHAARPLPHEELEKVGGNVQVLGPPPDTLQMYFEIKSHARGRRNRLTGSTCHAPLPCLRALVLTARSCYYWTVHRVLRAEMPRGLLAC